MMMVNVETLIWISLGSLLFMWAQGYLIGYIHGRASGQKRALDQLLGDQGAK